MCGLTNEQIVFVYFSLKATCDRYHEVLNKGQMTQIILGMGGHMVSSRLSDDVLNDIRTSGHFKALKETVDTLHPIYELIEEVEPEMVKSIKKLFDS